MLDVHLSTFQVDATPPIGHPLCGGWIRPVEAVDDPLTLRGLILEGSGLPIVLAAVDWTGVGNESHRIWTEAIAGAAGTTPDRVALHCVHQHNAPMVDREGNEMLRAAGAPILLYDPDFFERVVGATAAAVRAAMSEGRPVDRVRWGEATVRRVACNRRVIGADGKVKFTRTSATTDPAARAEPEGTIDPSLKSIGLYRGDRALARLYFYATHPMSYYGDGRVSADFVGLARASRDADEPEVFHAYFTGCAGDVTAGKYNDGARSNRAVLADRLAAAMAEADASAEEGRLDSVEWRSAPFVFAPREDLDLDRLAAIVADPGAKTVDRNRSAFACGWLRRSAAGRPVSLGSLGLGVARTLHLPGETFVAYQLAAAAIDPACGLAVAAYADAGPWYIPLARSYGEGGYEPSVSWVSPTTEPRYAEAIAALLREA